MSLWDAVCRKKEDDVKKLLKEKAHRKEINSCHEWMSYDVYFLQTPLQRSVLGLGSPNIIRMLLDAGADPELPDASPDGPSKGLNCYETFDKMQRANEAPAGDMDNDWIEFYAEFFGCRDLDAWFTQVAPLLRPEKSKEKKQKV
jgi:hypothetical protein